MNRYSIRANSRFVFFDERKIVSRAKNEKKKKKKEKYYTSLVTILKDFTNDPGLLSKDPKYAKHIDGDRFVDNIDVRLHDPRVSISSNWRGGTCHRLVNRAGI